MYAFVEYRSKSDHIRSTFLSMGIISDYQKKINTSRRRKTDILLKRGNNVS